MGKIKEKIKKVFSRKEKPDTTDAAEAKKETDKLKKKMNFTGLWFWRKNKQPKTEVNKAEEMLQMYLKYIPQIRALANGASLDSVTDGQMIGRMYDFFSDYHGGVGGNVTANGFFHGTIPQPMAADGNFEDADTPADVYANGLDVPDQFLHPNPKDKRKEAKPVDVVGELETVPTPFTLEGLDEKIALFKSKSKISVQRYAKAQIDGFLKRLENRKKYRDNLEFFGQFPNTTDDKIEALLKNYKLEMQESELFIPTFPKEAIDVMEKYTDMCEKLFNEKPVFYVIAEEKDFKKKREKLDPILLVQSPFGFYWSILGAWDQEMLLLSEL